MDTSGGLTTDPVHLVSEVDVVLVCDHGKGTLTESLLPELMATAGRHNVPVLVDPARGRPWDIYQGATLIKCNEHELAGIAPVTVITKGGAGLELWMSTQSTGPEVRQLASPTGVKLPQSPLATGAQLRQGSEVSIVPARPSRVVDTTGCGDQVLAVLGLCAAAGIGWLEACRLAVVAAGLQAERRGAVPVRPDEVRSGV
jgi:D-beta-D-heptose 7-phosphate kinase/D-beta-D-heptose 1-phosphate adenosyltransferase